MQQAIGLGVIVICLAPIVIAERAARRLEASRRVKSPAAPPIIADYVAPKPSGGVARTQKGLATPLPGELMERELERDLAELRKVRKPKEGQLFKPKL